MLPIRGCGADAGCCARAWCREQNERHHDEVS
jgi:hypothetical protein